MLLKLEAQKKSELDLRDGGSPSKESKSHLEPQFTTKGKLCISTVNRQPLKPVL